MPAGVLSRCQSAALSVIRSLDGPARHACCSCPPDSPDRPRAGEAEGDGLRPQDRVPAANACHAVLHAARGRSNARIAAETGLHLVTVRLWRGRFADADIDGRVRRRRPRPHRGRDGRPGVNLRNNSQLR
ncbi:MULTISPECIES: helix-turn-helix domain-containing protein [unclassified Streptomyces]|uniref:helix-turn-helix domain-containing protein n=1 Tax=unclassified Streptomyces TaxID=2593676 RepID=UPI0031BB70A9